MGLDATIYVYSPKILTEREITRLSYEICECYGHGEFMVNNPTEQKKRPTWPAHHAFTTLESQDWGDWDFLSDEIKKNLTHGVGTMLTLHYFGRYYGVGYERGDLPKILSVLNWVRLRIHNSTVFYGGDGDCAEFTEDEGHELFNHFVFKGHRPYLEGWAHEGGESPECPMCKEQMGEYGWGPDETRFQCFGCEYRVMKKKSTGEIVPEAERLL